MNASSRLWEREAEIAEMAHGLDGLRAGRGQLLVVTGASGTGKTCLLHELRQRAGAAQLRVLHARGHQRETAYPFGAVHQLFDPLLARMPITEWNRLFRGAAANARSLFESSGSTPPPPNPETVLQGLWWTVLALTESHPLCLVVDDLQWCDLESLQWLAFLAHRVDSGPVLLAVAVRTGDVAQDEELVQELAAQPHALRLHPRPLGQTSTQGLVAHVLGEPAASALGQACHMATGGNPLWLHELLRALTAGPRPGADLRAEDVRRIGARTLSALILRRLAALSTEAVMLARASSILGEDLPLRYAAELAGLSEDAAATAAQRLQQAELLGPGPAIHHVHPVIAESIHESLTPSERVEGHTEAAVILRRHGEPLHRVAAHVMLVPPGRYDDGVAILQQAATAAQASGAPRTAVAFLRRLLAEPLSDELRTQVLSRLGTIEMLIDGPAAVTHLREASAALTDPTRRAQLALALGPALSFTQHNREAVEVYEHALAELLPGGDERLRQSLLAGLLAAAVDDSTLAPAAEKHAAALREAPVENLDPPLASIMAWHEARTGSPRERCTKLAHRGLTLKGDQDTAAIFAYAGLVLALSGRHEDTRSLCSRRLEYAHRTGSVFDFAIASWLRGIAAFITGDVEAAEADQRQAIEAGEEHQLSAGLIYGYSRLAEALIERGELAEAEQALNQVPCPDPLPPLAHYDWWLYTRCRLRLAQRRHQEALTDAIEVGRRYGALGGVNPAFLPWRSEAALASVSLTDQQTAIKLADQDLELALSWGAPLTIGRALRVAGTVRREAGLPQLRDSVDVLQDSNTELEYAHTLVELGTTHHRLGQRSQAREALWQGLELARRCNADALADRAHQTLITAGARPRRLVRTGVAGLTPTERRVARLAGSGRSNREIAEELFVTPKTVEMHLGNVYRKLRIRSRTQLHTAMDQISNDDSLVSPPTAGR